MHAPRDYQPSRLAPHRWCHQLHAANFIALAVFAVASAPNPTLLIALLALDVLLGMVIGTVILMSPKRERQVRDARGRLSGATVVDRIWVRAAVAADIVLLAALVAADIALALSPGLPSTLGQPGAGPTLARAIGGGGCALLGWFLFLAHRNATDPKRLDGDGD